MHNLPSLVNKPTSSWNEEAFHALHEATFGDKENPEQQVGTEEVIKHTSSRQLQANLGKKAVTAEWHEESVAEEVSRWVKDFVKLDCKAATNDCGEEIRRYDWSPILPDDTFLTAHRQEILAEVIDRFAAAVNGPQFRDLTNTLSGGEDLSEELVSKMAVANPGLIIDKSWLYPNIRFGIEHIDSMVSAKKLWKLMRHWRMIEPECLQYAVDKVIEHGPLYIEPLQYELPTTIKLTEQQMVKIAREEPAILYVFLQHGRFPEAGSSVSVLKTLTDAGYCGMATRLISSDLVSRLSFAELANVYNGGLSEDIVRMLDKAGRLNSEDAVYDLLDSVRFSSLITFARDLSVLIQSCIFKALVTEPSKRSKWGEYISYFDELQEEDYEFLVDNVDDFINGGATISSLNEILSLAGHNTLRRFKSEAEPKFAKLKDEIQEREARNERRQHQRMLEDEYFSAGSYKVDAYGYGEDLSVEETIEAFEHGHCVRGAGVLRDIANDTTRADRITCVESYLRMTTSQLGSGVDEKDKVVLVCTEHEALQQLLGYLDDSKMEQPSNTFFDDLTNNLSYIGEKEYAEAVKGIAAYWKWFLDKDSENQLYVDTVISSGDGNTKSDMYMFDRILEHFSDSEMQKYEGKLITKEIDILQDDPSKIKVVLLDDWTISGSQLRGGYMGFVGDHPALVSSIEVQLIAASAERVALGIEGVGYSTERAQSREKHVPIVTRAYYLAHKADVSKSDAVGARITGSHSSVDFGFATDIGTNKTINDRKLPWLANIVRPYRQKVYKPTNVERLEKLYRTE